MIFLPEVCLEPKNNWLDFGDDTNYDPDPDLTDLHETFIRGVSLVKDQPIKLWEWSELLSGFGLRLLI